MGINVDGWVGSGQGGMLGSKIDPYFFSLDTILHLLLVVPGTIGLIVTLLTKIMYEGTTVINTHFEELSSLHVCLLW